LADLSSRLAGHRRVRGVTGSGPGHGCTRRPAGGSSATPAGYAAAVHGNRARPVIRRLRHRLAAAPNGAGPHIGRQTAGIGAAELAADRRGAGLVVLNDGGRRGAGRGKTGDTVHCGSNSRAATARVRGDGGPSSRVPRTVVPCDLREVVGLSACPRDDGRVRPRTASSSAYQLGPSRPCPTGVPRCCSTPKARARRPIFAAGPPTPTRIQLPEASGAGCARGMRRRPRGHGECNPGSRRHRLQHGRPTYTGSTSEPSLDTALLGGASHHRRRPYPGSRRRSSPRSVATHELDDPRRRAADVRGAAPAGRLAQRFRVASRWPADPETAPRPPTSADDAGGSFNLADRRDHLGDERLQGVIALFACHVAGRGSRG